MVRPTHVGKGVEFVGAIPGENHLRGSMSWANHLQPLLKRPGQWALIEICDTPAKASKTQSNLTQRALAIPHPSHNWEFASRGCEVYGVYRGNSPSSKRSKKDASVRRAYRKR